MKVIEVGKRKSGEGRLSGLNRSLGRMIPSAAREAQSAQEAVVNLFSKILDNRFFMLQGVRFQDFDGLPPLVLIGPPGIWVIEASPVSGMFRSAEDSWEEMDPKARIFRPARPNLPVRTRTAAGGLQNFLAEAVSAKLPPVEPLVLFTHPGAHLELQQPSVRLIQADAISRFAAGLLRSRIVLEKETIQRLADLLGQAPGDLAMEEPEGFELLPEAENPRPKPAQPIKIPEIPEEETGLVKRASRYTGFSRFQWTVLGLMFALVILLLMAVILIFLVIT
jgi:hypothetical protein